MWWEWVLHSILLIRRTLLGVETAVVEVEVLVGITLLLVLFAW